MATNKHSKDRLLALLQESKIVSSHGAAQALDLPRPSIRKLIQSLIRDGHRITSREQGMYGTEYQLW